MIRVHKNFDQPPPALKAQQLAFLQGVASKLSPNCRDELLELYGYKCGYCESNLEKCKTALHVEHYRPKKACAEDKHCGYDWLVFEWTNLTLVCAECNLKKKTRFPVEGIRVTRACHDLLPDSWKHASEADLQEFRTDDPKYKGEKALLLHPELDDPSSSFSFAKDGQIIGTDSRALKTIEIFDLNREGLKKERYLIIVNLIASYKVAIAKILKCKERGYFKSPDLRERIIDIAFQSFVVQLNREVSSVREFTVFRGWIGQHITDLAQFEVENLMGVGGIANELMQLWRNWFSSHSA